MQLVSLAVRSGGFGYAGKAGWGLTRQLNPGLCPHSMATRAEGGVLLLWPETACTEWLAGAAAISVMQDAPAKQSHQLGGICKFLL